MKKKDPVREIHHNDGRIEVQYSDGTSKLIDANGNALTTVTQSQLEAWKKAPKEQAVKEVLELIHRQDLDVSEKRFELDAYRFIAELQGAQAPVSQAANIIEIRISQPVIPEKRIIDVTAQEKKD